MFPLKANAALKAGDVLFRIDPVPFEAQVKALEAQLKFQDLRLSQMTQLLERDAGRAFDVQQRQSEVDQLKAQLEGAKWNLDKTVVRAPADGYVTNVALRKGARVASSRPMWLSSTPRRPSESSRYRKTMPAISRRGSRWKTNLQAHARHSLFRRGRDRLAGDLDRPNAGFRALR